MIEQSVKVLGQIAIGLLLVFIFFTIVMVYVFYIVGYKKGLDKGGEPCPSIDSTAEMIIDTKSSKVGYLVDSDTIWYDLRLLELKEKIKK